MEKNISDIHVNTSNLNSNEANLTEKKSLESPKYTSVQCVSFNIGTAARFSDYHGIRDEKLDSKERCKVMKDAIDIAEKSDKIDKSEKCMKVFMAPEFFFRGVEGGYKIETALDVVKDLQSMVNDPKYKDWLFVFGSIVCYSKGRPYLGSPAFEVYNFSLVHKGNTESEASKIVMKENKSPVDFNIDTGFGSVKLYDHNTDHLEPVNPKEERNEEKKWNYDSNAIFEIDGIRIGVEICLDNIERRIDNSKKIKEKLDIQLVPSCGVGQLTLSRNLKPTGLGFVCDGGSKNGGSYCKNYFTRHLKTQDIINFTPNKAKKMTYVFSGKDSTISIYTTHSLVREKYVRKGVTFDLSL